MDLGVNWNYYSFKSKIKRNETLTVHAATNNIWPKVLCSLTWLYKTRFLFLCHAYYFFVCRQDSVHYDVILVITKTLYTAHYYSHCKLSLFFNVHPIITRQPTSLYDFLMTFTFWLNCFPSCFKKPFVTFSCGFFCILSFPHEQPII